MSMVQVRKARASVNDVDIEMLTTAMKVSLGETKTELAI